MNQENCKCRQEASSRGGRFLEACLLCLLKDGDSYGYDLMDKLSTLAFVDQEINISLIYRNLRKMEKQGSIVSSWVKSDLGPDKRVYSISKAGLEALDGWIEVLKERRRTFDLIIEKYESKKDNAEIENP